MASEAVVAPGPELDLLTVNLWGLPWPAARHRRERKRRFVEHLTGRPYDLVGVQELWWPWRRFLRRAPLHIPPSRRDAGLALGGRLRVREARIDHFAHHGGVDRLKRKGVLQARVETSEGALLHVGVVHLQAGRRHGRLRARQLEELLGVLEAVRGPTVLMGDFNLHRDDDTDRHSAERLHAAGFVDAALALDRTEPTYDPSNAYVRRSREAQRLDRVYLRDAPDVRMCAVEAEVLRMEPKPLSDHHPLRVRVRLSA